MLYYQHGGRNDRKLDEEIETGKRVRNNFHAY